MCHKNQIQLHKNCSVDDFNVYMIQTGLVTKENTTCANGATFFVILGPVQGRCDMCVYTFYFLIKESKNQISILIFLIIRLIIDRFKL